MQEELARTARTTWWIGPALLGWIMVAATMVFQVGNSYLVDAISRDLNLSSDDWANVQTVRALAALLVVCHRWSDSVMARLSHIRFRCSWTFCSWLTLHSRSHEYRDAFGWLCPPWCGVWLDGRSGRQFW